MFAVAILAPGLILGAIAWGAVGVLRQRGREEFTLATAAAFYAQVLAAAGLLAALAGVGVLVKLGLSLLDPAYSYFVPPEPVGVSPVYAPPSVATQQAQDLILALMLLAIGLLVAGGHLLLAHFLAGQPGGAPAWIVRGTGVAVTVLTGLAGFLSLIVAGYQVLSFFVVGVQQGQSFGDAAGTALVFLPAWGVAVALLLRRVRHRAPSQASLASPAAG